MKKYKVRLYEGINRDKVNEVLKYFPDYVGKISVITTVINNKLELTLVAFEGINFTIANDLIEQIVGRLVLLQLVENHNLNEG
ncbi:hypothetical protein MKL42_03845 [Acinetobacter sp. AOR15_HL]|uniref:hypothetical protein n=1 Tax=unclassified Acinetobacter TaxID=196816 RepID=UPI0022EA244F|nr:MULTISPECIES: hypothetical protein [unclassified Acinetobacter]MDA3556652.1 hypothetical protein [Acinetobacter sp. AOR15_HL]MDA3573356.1 hypothetical protein [Acinetobacter sp. AOR14_HL]